MSSELLLYVTHHFSMLQSFAVVLQDANSSNEFEAVKQLPKLGLKIKDLLTQCILFTRMSHLL